MSIRTDVIISPDLLNMSKKAVKKINECMNDYTDDLLRVSTERTPVKSRTLEESGSSNCGRRGKYIVGEVGFGATRKGFNYGVKMHDGKYKLGEQSRAKSSGGVRSKYANRSFKVGSKFLEGTALSCQKGYTKDMEERLVEFLD